VRIGEVAIISHNTTATEDFIKSICGKIEIKNRAICFGRFEVDEQLALHLYGIVVDKENKSFFWDIASRKMMAYIFIFDWDDKNLLETIKPVIDHFSQNSDAPMIVVANIPDKSDPPIPVRFFQPNGIPLSTNARFTFGQITDSEDARKVMVLLVNMLIELIS